MNLLQNSRTLLFGAGFLTLCVIGAVITAVLVWPDPIDAPGEFSGQLTAIATSLDTTPVATGQNAAATSTQLPSNGEVPQPTQPAATLAATIESTQTQAASPTEQATEQIDPFGGLAPEGQIAFTCYIGGFDQICLMDADGSNRTQLTDTEATDFYASISADGQHLFFSSRRTGNFEVFWLLLENQFTTQVTDGIGSLFAPEVSPDGEWLVFTNAVGGNQSIWKMKLDGSDAFPLTTGGWDDIDPTWSPDGSRIAFASSRTGSRQLYVMDADGGNVQQVTDLPDMGGRSTWSPDGERLAFYAGPFADRDIYTIRIDGSDLQQLTNGGDNLGPSWSPDGNWIAFTSFRDGNNEIYIIRPDGTNPVNLTQSPISDWQPRWGPSDD